MRRTQLPQYVYVVQYVLYQWKKSRPQIYHLTLEEVLSLSIYTYTSPPIYLY